MSYVFEIIFDISKRNVEGRVPFIDICFLYRHDPVRWLDCKSAVAIMISAEISKTHSLSKFKWLSCVVKYVGCEATHNKLVATEDNEAYSGTGMHRSQSEVDDASEEVSCEEVEESITVDSSQQTKTWLRVWLVVWNNTYHI